MNNYLKIVFVGKAKTEVVVIVVILFIFVVMLLGSAATSPSDARSAVPRYLGAGVFLLSAAGALALVVKAAAETTKEAPSLPDGFGTIEKVGHEIFTTKVVPFELSGALLLVAVVGALAVARGKQPDPTRKLGPAEGDAKATEEGSA